MLLLQTAELLKTGAQAAGNVTEHANNDAFTSLSWLLNIVFGGALFLLIYKLVWKDKPIGAPEFADYKKELAADRLQQKLKVEADLAAVAGTLTRLADVAEELTTMTERVSWHGRELEAHKGQFKAVHEELKEVKTDIKTLFRATPTRA